MAHVVPGDNRGAWLPTESEFFAEDEAIGIVPKFRSGTLHFISGDFGPFEPQVQVDVPLWVAVRLKKTNKCTIVWPVWLRIEDLQQTFDFERSNQGFAPLPFHYVEMATILFATAAEDYEHAKKALALLEDVKTLRAQKIRRGVGQVLEHCEEQAPPTWVQLSNVASMEVNSIRSNFFQTIDKLYAFALRDPIVAPSAVGGGAGGSDGGGETMLPRREVRRRMRARRRHAPSDEAGAGVGMGAGAGAGPGAGAGAGAGASGAVNPEDIAEDVWGGEAGSVEDDPEAHVARKLRRHR